MGKGGRFERACSRDLTEWLTRWQAVEPRRDPPELWRTKQSGGWPHRQIPDVLDLAPDGDLGAEFRQRFAVECKHQTETVLWSLFTQDVPKIARWWRKAWDECREYEGLYPLLMVRKTRLPLLVGHPSRLIPTTEVRFERAWVSEELGLRLVAWDEWYDLPVGRLYGLHDRWQEAAHSGPDRGGP